jgi:hypothetical protein
MKKLVLALAAVGCLSVPASAAPLSDTPITLAQYGGGGGGYDRDRDRGYDRDRDRGYDRDRVYRRDYDRPRRDYDDYRVRRSYRRYDDR